MGRHATTFTLSCKLKTNLSYRAIRSTHSPLFTLQRQAVTHGSPEHFQTVNARTAPRPRAARASNRASILRASQGAEESRTFAQIVAL
jgi:hypothetical protein